MIVATAGHIDHGKTRLVGTITGVDTDRLPEEKARGISIDVGFAYWTSPSGRLIGFVDVPGHERFVRNMLAGVCGIDFALVIVAADDGVMPQTTEHVQILDLLGIRRSLVAMTKVDRVDPPRRQQVRQEIRTLLEGTTLEGAEIVEISAMTGEGIGSVKEKLAVAADALAETAVRRAGHFRLAVDRSFSVGGSGTVVTGTVFDGEVQVGARLRVSPSGMEVRVRGIRVHVMDSGKVHAGQRCALNLAGVAVDQVRRGDWIVAEAIHRPTQRIDAAITLLAPGRCSFSATSRVHLHLGAADVLARVRPLQGDPSDAKAGMLVELTLDRAVAAVHGDSFILRDSGAHRTLGGGRVLDPFAAGGRRRSVERIARLTALAAGGVDTALPAVLASVQSIDRERIETTFNLQADAARALYSRLEVEVLDPIVMSREAYVACCDGIHAGLAAFHAANPGTAGMKVQDLRRAVAPKLPASHFDTVLKRLAGAQGVTVRGDLVRLARHGHTAPDADQPLWSKVEPLLAASIAQPPRVAELAAALGCEARTVGDMLYRQRAAGAVFRIGEDRFCLRSSLASLAATAVAVARSTADGSFTAAQFRDAIGSGRILAIQILEALDALGVTLRVGDRRRIYRDPVALLGSAQALVPPPAAQRTPAPSRQRAR